MKKIITLFLMILIITGCSKKELDLDKISNKLNATDYFTENDDVDLNYLEKKYALKSEGILEYKVSMSKMSKSASIYAIFKIKDNNTKKNIDDFIKRYTDSWTTVIYDEKEAALVNNMHSEVYGDYLIYVISIDNEEIMKIIKE